MRLLAVAPAVAACQTTRMAAETQSETAPSTLRAALWMSASIASFLTMTVASRALVDAKSIIGLLLARRHLAGEHPGLT